MTKRHKAKKKMKKNQAEPRTKSRVGHCDNPWCGEREHLRTVSVQIDGKTHGRPQRLCRACTAVLVTRVVVHERGWPTR